MFHQKEGEPLYFEAESSNYGFADAFTNQYGLLTVVAAQPGRARILSRSQDSCHGRATTSFHFGVVRYETIDETAFSL